MGTHPSIHAWMYWKHDQLIIINLIVSHLVSIQLFGQPRLDSEHAAWTCRFVGTLTMPGPASLCVGQDLGRVTIGHLAE